MPRDRTATLVKRVLIATTPSDVHSWNLVFLSLVAQDAGMDCRVVGPAPELEEITAGVADFDPDIVLVSSINGHGEIEAGDVMAAVRRGSENVPVLIGGNLGVRPEESLQRRESLLRLGYKRVFEGAELSAEQVMLELEQIPQVREIPSAVAVSS